MTSWWMLCAVNIDLSSNTKERADGKQTDACSSGNAKFYAFMCGIIQGNVELSSAADTAEKGRTQKLLSRFDVLSDAASISHDSKIVQHIQVWAHDVLLACLDSDPSRANLTKFLSRIYESSKQFRVPRLEILVQKAEAILSLKRKLDEGLLHPAFLVAYLCARVFTGSPWAGCWLQARSRIRPSSEE